MKYLKMVQIIVFCLVVLGMTSSIQYSDATVTVRSDQVSVTLSITNAYYLAYGADNIKNDIIVCSKFNIVRLVNDPKITPPPGSSSTYVVFDFQIKLTLPSGKAYQYLYTVQTAKAELLPVFCFENHATESGWYTAAITIFLPYQNTNTYISGTERYIFDPPGSTGGTEPLKCKLLSY